MNKTIALIFFFSTLIGLTSAGQTKTLPVTQAKQFCIKNKLDTNIFLFVDMSIHSGKYRAFLYQSSTDSVLVQGLCSHGCCENYWAEDNSKTNPVFSNISGSHCSSLGKYKIGTRGYSNWGININYKLHGLETSNNNAYRRTIVLHSWEQVSETECYPNGTPEGWGCPAFANSTFRKIDKYLKSAKQPVLLWIYH